MVWLIAALAVGIVAFTPSKATAGWGWWGGPGISITIGPRYYRPYSYGYYGYRYAPYGYYGYRYRPYGYYGYRYRPYYGYRRYGYYGNRGYLARRAYRRWR
jgi:hypothetical protein